jgi:hypothetical protein
MIDREEARRLLEASFDHLEREAAADTEEARRRRCSKSSRTSSTAQAGAILYTARR